MYRRVFLPLVLAVIFEKWFSILKWVLIGISVVISVNNGHSAITSLLISFGFLVFIEIVFNSVMMNRIIYTKKASLKIVSIIVFTLCLMRLQFLMKDMNVISWVFRKRGKKNKW